ncbi:MAG: hypothetical protein KF797_04350 [Flavobacteriales bacterium]|nr:hypothetical protein [Flavobacteriales bacterium]
MKRSIKPRKVGVMPWLISLVLVGGALVGIFSLGHATWLAKIPGLRIGAAEWSLYQRLFDRHPAATDQAALPILRFGDSKEVDECMQAQRGGAWRTRWFEGDGYGDSVEVRNLLDREGFLVRFKKNTLYKEQRRVMLTPATAESRRVAELQEVAHELGLVTPSLSLVRVLSCGDEIGIFQQQEWVDAEFLDNRGIRGASLVKFGMDPSRPDQQFPAIEADSAEQVKLRGIIERALAEAAAGNTDMLAGMMDERSVAAWALMAWIDERDLRATPVTFTYNWANGRFAPIYQPPVVTDPMGGDDPLVHNPITPLLKRADLRMRFENLQTDLAAKWPELQQRSAAKLAQWPVLPGASFMASLSASHITSSEALAHMDRTLLAGPGHATFVHGMPLPPVVVGTGVDTVQLARLVQRHKLIARGDSIIFPRGKYMIDEDVEFPAGRSVLMLEGARLFMAPGRSMLVKGDLYIRGTLRNPVFIRAQDDGRPFGAIAVLGGSSQQCAISGLYVSGGAGAKLADIVCGGMVTVQGAVRTSIANSVFQENAAGASLLVDGGELEMREVRFEDAAKCFAQLDHVRGVLRDLVMIGARANITTGLRIGTGTMAVLGGTYTNLKGPAVLADGACQVLVRNARLAQNAIAVRSEGRAEVHVEGNTIDGNDVAFATGTSVPGDRIILYPNRLTGNKAERGSEGGFKERPALDEATVAQFGVPFVEPKAEAGASRIKARR